MPGNILVVITDQAAEVLGGMMDCIETRGHQNDVGKAIVCTAF